MESFRASKAKNKFGELLDNARREPVIIEKHARPTAVLMAYEEYQRLQEIEDRFLAERADEVVGKDAWLGVKQSEKLLDDALNEND